MPAPSCRIHTISTSAQAFYNFTVTINNLLTTINNFLATVNNFLATVNNFLATVNNFLATINNFLATISRQHAAYSRIYHCNLETGNSTDGENRENRVYSKKNSQKFC